MIGRTHISIGDKVYSTIDYLEQNVKIYDNVRDNLFSPLILSIVCKKLNKHFTYISTGCIFKFDKLYTLDEQKIGFQEEDKPNFFGSS